MPPLRALAVWLMFLCVSGVAVLGVLQLRYNDGLIRTFESDQPRYRDYTAFVERFDSDAGDVLILFEGRDIAAPEVLTALRNFLLDVQFVDGVFGVISPLGLRVVNDAGQIEPLVPDPIPDAAVMQARFASERGAAPDLRRLMSEDRTMLLVIASLGAAVEDAEARTRILAEVEDLAQAAAADAELTATLTGFPVLRDRIAQALFDDLILLNVIGACVAIAVGSISLRSVTLGFLTAIVPLTSLLWVLALLGYLGIQINVITVALPVLILVLATSDAIHLSIEAARLSRQGCARPEIAAVRRIAPACVMAALTTAVAFGALTLSSSVLIGELGQAGAIATLVSVVAVFLTHPLVFMTATRIIGRERLFAPDRGTPPAILDLAAVPAWAVRAPWLISLSALGLLVLATAFYAQIEPRFSLVGDLRAENEGVAAMRRIDASLAPTGALIVPVRIAETEQILPVHRMLADRYEPANVFSLADFADRAAAAGLTLDEVLDAMPGPLARRLVSEDGTEATVNVLFSYRNAQDTRDRTVDLEAALATADMPGISGPVTGIAVMSSFVSHAVLWHINVSFLTALFGATALIAIWLRRLVVAGVALLTNLLPIACVGAWLAASGTGLEFSGALALTIAFGLAIDDTVHVLNRVRLSRRFDALQDAKRVAEATGEVAPALVITSAVLAMGMTGTLLAQLVSVNDFGILSIAVFVLALLADLVVLPASLVAAGQLQVRFRGWRAR